MIYEDRPQEEYATAKESRKSRLPLAEQDQCISEQTEVITILLDRLESVLTPQPESTAKDGGDHAVPMRSQLASELDSNNSRIRRNTNRLSNALERLEV